MSPWILYTVITLYSISNMTEEEIVTYVKMYEGQLPFYSDYKAYVTWNAVFFDGLENEELKILENKKFNTDMIAHCTELIHACKVLFHACTPCTTPMITTRVERLYDFQQMQKAGRTIAFTSTSKNSFLKQYQDKEGIVLLECHLPKGTRCADFAHILQDYQKTDEAEVLLPPYTKLDISDLPLSHEEMRILDKSGHSPFGKYCLKVQGIDFIEEPQFVITQQDIEGAIRFLTCLNANKTYAVSDADKYIQLKKALRYHIRNAFSEEL